jgi:predicted nucleic acid-binding protein
MSTVRSGPGPTTPATYRPLPSARNPHRLRPHVPAFADLTVAAVAEIEGLTVLHHDGDFDLIAAITGQPVEWIV